VRAAHVEACLGEIGRHRLRMIERHPRGTTPVAGGGGEVRRVFYMPHI
jgi:hypothetical protein